MSPGVVGMYPAAIGTVFAVGDAAYIVADEAAADCDSDGGFLVCITHDVFLQSRGSWQAHMANGVHGVAWFCGKHHRLERPTL